MDGVVLISPASSTRVFEGASVDCVPPPMAVMAAHGLPLVLDMSSLWVKEHYGWNMAAAITCLQAVLFGVSHGLLDLSIGFKEGDDSIVTEFTRKINH